MILFLVMDGDESVTSRIPSNRKREKKKNHRAARDQTVTMVMMCAVAVKLRLLMQSRNIWFFWKQIKRKKVLKKKQRVTVHLNQV